MHRSKMRLSHSKKTLLFKRNALLAVANASEAMTQNNYTTHGRRNKMLLHDLQNNTKAKEQLRSQFFYAIVKEYVLTLLRL